MPQCFCKHHILAVGILGPHLRRLFSQQCACNASIVTRVESSSLNMETLDAVWCAEVSGIWALMDSKSSFMAKLEVQCKDLVSTNNMKSNDGRHL